MSFRDIYPTRADYEDAEGDRRFRAQRRCQKCGELCEFTARGVCSACVPVGGFPLEPAGECPGCQAKGERPHAGCPDCGWA